MFLDGRAIFAQLEYPFVTAIELAGILFTDFNAVQVHSLLPKMLNRLSILLRTILLFWCAWNGFLCTL